MLPFDPDRFFHVSLERCQRDLAFLEELNADDTIEVNLGSTLDTLRRILMYHQGFVPIGMELITLRNEHKNTTHDTYKVIFNDEDEAYLLLKFT